MPPGLSSRDPLRIAKIRSSIGIDASGAPQVLNNFEYLDWNRKVDFNWAGIGAFNGNDSFGMTTGGSP